LVDWAALPGIDLWCNPPFNHLDDWTAKAANYAISPRQNARLFMLLPASVGSEWYYRNVNGTAHVILLRPRVTFLGCDQPYPKDLVLAIYESARGGVSTWRWK